MPHVIVGTAGHIDHGKSSLVKALTGIDPDRLPEEKERGMTIDLGYAHLKLANGEEVGIVDVPGHERFVKNMLAGATGVDFALLIVAADDGVMPQTREHLQILDLLRIRRGLVVVNKVDLVDEETLALVEEEIRELLKGRLLEAAPVVRVSALTGQGIPELRQRIFSGIENLQKESVRAFFRLPIDRSFSISGFGCVVTGTVASGRARVGDEMELLPEGKRVKIRGIQVHGHDAPAAEQGQRAALNLAGVKADEVRRGCQVAVPGQLQASNFLAAEFLLLSDVRQPLKNFTAVKLHLGTVEVVARAAFLDRSARLAPGETCLVQFRLEEPVVADRDDRYVVRALSPLRTLGGGRILHVGTEKISRFQSEMIHYVKSLTQPDALSHLEAELLRPRASPPTLEDLSRDLGLSTQDVRSRLTQLGDRCISIQEGRTERFVHRQTLEDTVQSIEAALLKVHEKRPVLLGLMPNELKRDLPESQHGALFNLAVDCGIRLGRLARTGLCLHRSGWSPQLDAAAQSIRSDMLQRLEKAPFETPRASELIESFKLGRLAGEVFLLLVQSGAVVQISQDVILLKKTLDQAKAIIQEHISQKGEITVADLRDRLGTSRKYALPLLEFLDEIGFTQRIGDKRVLKHSGGG